MLTLKEKNSKAVIVCFGRFQPPTIGHLEQVKFMAKEADDRGVEARLYTSHTNDAKKNPLTYEQKIKWLKKAFGHLVDVEESPARTIIEVLAELYKEGFTEVYYTGGSDREGVGDLVLQYNGKPDKSGNIVYSFDVLEPLISGQRVEGISGTDVRNFVKDGDFESFEKLVPFDEVDAQELFYELRDGLGVKESLDEDYTGNTVGSLTIAGNTYDLKSTGHTGISPKYKLAYGAPVTQGVVARLFNGQPFELNIPEFSGEITNYNTKALERHIQVFDSEGYTLCNIDVVVGDTQPLNKAQIRNVLKDLFMDNLDDGFRVINSGKHKDELLRVGLVNINNVDNPEAELVSSINSIIGNISSQLPLQLKSITLEGITPDKIYFYTDLPTKDLSHTYKVYKVIFDIINSFGINEKLDFYITLVSKVKKFFVPNKVLSSVDMDRRIEYTSLNIKSNMEGVPLDEIYKEAIGVNGLGGVKYGGEDRAERFLAEIQSGTKPGDFTFTSTIDPSLISGLSPSVINGIIIDFSEVLGAGCFAKIVADVFGGADIKFPGASNSELCDYTIYADSAEFKVSAKAQGGAAPAVTGPFKTIIEYLKSNRVIIPNDRVLSFINWMNDNVAERSITVHEGFVNMANLATGKTSADWYKNIKGEDFADYFEVGSLNLQTVDNFIELLPRLGRGLKFDKKRLAQSNSEVNSYLEACRIRYLARLVINYINNDPELLDGFNDLLRAALGRFIQIYLDGKDIRSGKLKFTAKVPSENTNTFMFVDGSEIFKSGDKYVLYTKKLSMVMK